MHTLDSYLLFFANLEHQSESVFSNLGGGLEDVHVTGNTM